MIYCDLTFNGYPLDTLIPGYTTINVENRTLQAPIIEAIDIPGRDGSYVLGQKLGPKTIRVHFMLKANNNPEFLTRLQLLQNYLRSDDDVEFSFGDEQGVRYGRVSGFEEPPYDQNQGTGIISIYCQDPYRYSQPKTTTESVASSSILPVKIESISLTISSPATQLILSNRGKKIQLIDNFETGDQVIITPHKITKNNQDIFSKLDYVLSDFHSFKLFDGDTISVNPTTTATIVYRERL